MKTYDAIIVGAGLAGSATAIHLAKANKCVLIIEKEKEAHHKVCGEFLSAEAETYLSNLDINLQKIGAKKINNLRLIHGAKSISTKLPFEAFSLPRFILDEALLQKAVEVGAEVKRGVTVGNIHREGGCWHVSAGSFSAKSKALFLANGKHEIKGWQRSVNPKQVENDYIGFKMHYLVTPEKAKLLSDFTEIILFKGGYAGLQLVAKNTANLCLVVKKSRFFECGKNWEDLLNKICIETPHLTNILENAKSCWDKPLTIFGIPYGYTRNASLISQQGIYYLGDQIGVIPSFVGGGMAIALYSAGDASNAYLNYDDVHYAKMAKKKLGFHIRKSYWLGMLISFPATSKALFNLCSLMPFLLRIFAKQTRL